MNTKRNLTIDIDSNCFDVIRVFCAVIILFGHYITHFKVDSQLSFYIAYFIRGVPVFFFLSGFLVARSIERYNVRGFFIKRFFRIYPVLWVCIILNTLIILCFYDTYPSMKEFFIYIITQFSFFQFYTGDWLREYGVGVPNGALWTISTDIQFYFVVFLLAKYLKGRTLTTWLIIIGLCAIFSFCLEFFNQYIPLVIYKLLYVSLLPFLYIFLFGMMTYYFKDLIIPFLVKNIWTLVIMYVIWINLPADFISLFNGMRYNVITTLLLMCNLVAIGYKFGSIRSKVDYSYSFYLYHMVVINFIFHMFIKDINNTWDAIWIFLVSFFITSILAWLSVKLIDQKLALPLEKRLMQK